MKESGDGKKGQKGGPELCCILLSVTEVLLKGPSPVVLENSVRNKLATPGGVVLRRKHLEKEGSR